MGGKTTLEECTKLGSLTDEQRAHFEEHQFIVTQNNSFGREIYYTGSTLRAVLTIVCGDLTTG